MGGNITVHGRRRSGHANIAVAANTSAGRTSPRTINKLDIEGLTVGVNKAGDQLSFKSRNDATSSSTLHRRQVSAPRLTLTALAAPVDTKKGILDKTYDAYRRYTSTWRTFSVATIDISKLTDSASDLRSSRPTSSGIDDAFAQITDAATNLGAIKNRIGLQQDFVKTLTNSLDRGIGQLVDADMNAEFDPPAGPPGPAAARYPGPVDRQLGQPEHPVAVQVVTNVAP